MYLQISAPSTFHIVPFSLAFLDRMPKPQQGNNMNLGTRLGNSTLFVARAIHRLEGDEQCAQPFFQPATQILSDTLILI